MGLDRAEMASVRFALALDSLPGDLMASSLLKAAEERASYFLDTNLYTVRQVDLFGIEGSFGATLLGDRVVFAGERSVAAGTSNPWNGLSFLDLYSTTRSSSGYWTTPEPMKGEVNGRYHEGPAVFSTDGRTMYFTRSDYYKFRLNKDGGNVSQLKLFRSEMNERGEWGNIHQFAYNGDAFSTGHAALSADGNVLYFISDRPGGLGGTDIYKCRRTNDTWGEPEGLGPIVNTVGNEMFPTINGDTLYFSSNGHPGIGGLDIFRTFLKDGEWTTPVNMNYPINSRADDMGLVFQKDRRSGFLSSDRSGKDKIHSFTVNEPMLITKGICINAETALPMADVRVRMLDIINGESLTMMTGEDGKFEFKVRRDRNIQFQGSKQDMLTETVDINTHGQNTSKTYQIEMKMRPIEIDRPIVVNNIYYDYDRWDIRPDAAEELRKLGRLFINNPDVTFELSSHTDSRASEPYNLVLSDARAKSAVDFLIRQGVDPNRITAKGYGESKLVNKCSDNVECTEDEHQQNRRTEFKVLKTEIVQK